MRGATIAHNGLMIAMAFALSACAGLTPRDPLEVTVAGIESLPGEGMEMRMMVKLRVQNPNDAPIEYNGVFLKVDVLDKSFASGVSDERGTVPRFGESIISVPLAVSTLRVALHAAGMVAAGGSFPEKVPYKMEGKLGGSAFGSTKFQAKGELALPGATAPQ
jgi:LEA14-like dessication related protein